MKPLEEETKEDLIEIFLKQLKEKTNLPVLLEKPFRIGAADVSREDLIQRIRNLELRS